MKLEVKIELLKFFFSFLNALFLVLGLSVGGCGIWILLGSGSFLNVLPSDELQVVATGLLVIGAVVVLVSLVGCVGSSSGSRFMLVVHPYLLSQYCSLLIVLVLGQLFVMLLLLINRDQINRALTATVQKIILDYGNRSDINDRMMDAMQETGRCCGLTRASDWLGNAFVQTLNLSTPDVLPCSCYEFHSPTFNSSWCSENPEFLSAAIGGGANVFKESCSGRLQVWLQQNILTIISMDVILILLQMIDVAMAATLYQMFGRKAALKKDEELFHEGGDGDADSNPDGEQNHGYTHPEGEESQLNRIHHQDHAVHGAGPPRPPSFRGHM